MLAQEQVKSANETPAIATLLQMIAGRWVSQTIVMAAHYGIADLLKEGAQSVDALALATQTDPKSLYRFLRALASLGVIAEREDGQFEIAPLGIYLQTDAPVSLRSLALMFGQDWQHRVWRNLPYSLQTSQPAFEQQFGMSFYEYFAHNASVGQNFDEAMTSLSGTNVSAIADAYDFSQFSRIIDIAGGHGLLLSTILKMNPGLQGILFDVPNVLEGAKTAGVIDTVRDRIDLVAGNYFEGVPQDADAYLFKLIIHDWNDDRACELLKRCYQSMPDHSKLLVIEHVIADGNEPDFGKLLDVEILLTMSGGRERTATEYRELFASAGFKLTRIVPTQSTVSIVEGVKIL